MGRLIPAFILVLVFSGCFTTRDLSNTNLASFYKPNDNVYHPEFSVWNQKDSTLILYTKVLPEEFLYVRQPDNGYKSFVKIIAEVVRSYDNTKVLDSISSVFSFDILDKSTQQVLSMKVPVKQNGELKLRIVIYDLNKGAYEDYFVPLEINSTISRNDFAFTDKAGNIILKNYFNIRKTLNKNKKIIRNWR